MNDVFDFREAAKLALGREWTARTPKEQNEFVAMFADLLERSFVWRVAGKASLGGGAKVRYLDERVTGDVALVDTELAGRDGNEIQLAVPPGAAQRAAGWSSDVVMDGVSTMQNYHAQFQRIVRESSYTALASQLRTKLGMSAVGARCTARSHRAAAAPSAADRLPFGSREIGGPIDLERQALARDVAAVVTPRPGGERRAAAATTPRPAPPRRRRRSTLATPPPPSRSAPATRRGPRGRRDAATGRVAMPIASDSSTPTAAPTAPSPRADSPAPIAGPGHGPRAGRVGAVRLGGIARDGDPREAVARRGSAPRAGSVGARPGVWGQVGAYRDTTTAGRVAKAVNGES